MIAEFISGKIVAETAVSYAIEQAISKLLSLVFQVEKDNKKLLRSDFITAKELLELAHLHLKNGEIEQYYRELGEAAKYFRDAAPKLDPLEEIQTLCFTGICYRLLGEETKKKFYFDKTLKRLDVFINLRVKKITRKAQDTSQILNPNSKISEKTNYINKFARFASTPGAPMGAALFMTPIVISIIFTFSKQGFNLQHTKAVFQSIRLFFILSFGIYTAFFLRTKIGKEMIKNKVLTEDFPGFSGTSIGQMQAALKAGIN